MAQTALEAITEELSNKPTVQTTTLAKYAAAPTLGGEKEAYRKDETREMYFKATFYSSTMHLFTNFKIILLFVYLFETEKLQPTSKTKIDSTALVKVCNFIWPRANEGNDEYFILILDSHANQYLDSLGILIDI